MKRLMKTLGSFIALLLLLIVGSIQVHAENTESKDGVNIIIHKVLIPNGQMPDAEIQNDGKADGQTADLLKDYQGLNGVTFEVYDVTDSFYKLREENSVEEAQQILSQKNNLSRLDVLVASGVTGTQNGEKGLASFQLPAKDATGRDTVYLFHEIANTRRVLAASKNLVVVLPVIDDNGAPMTEIHLFPKNEETVPPDERFVKEVVNGKANYEFGDNIDYVVSTKIPNDISDLKKFIIKDAADKTLRYKKGSIQLLLNGEKLPDFYDLNMEKNGFRLEFTDMEKLGAYIGDTLVISYSMTFIGADNSADSSVNTARLETDQETLERKVEVKTGGKRFRKVDLEDQLKGLSGAEFHVLDQKERLLIKTADGFSWTTDPQHSQLVTLVSKTDGSFEINGLTYGQYYLEEVTAPNGYQLSETLTSFTVDATSFDAKSEPLKIVNLKNSDPPNKPGKPTTPVNKKTNVKRYPKTNDTVNRSLVLLGAILIAVVVVILWKKRKNEE